MPNFRPDNNLMLRMPLKYEFQPYLLNNPNSLIPQTLLSKGRVGVSMAIGKLNV